MSPIPAAPRRASVTACRTTSASLWPASPRGCGMWTPPRTSRRPSATRWVSCPLPTRMAWPIADSSVVRQWVVVLEQHELPPPEQGDVPRRAVPLLQDEDFQLVVLRHVLVPPRAVQHDA